jgi:hypothetical protein
VALDTIDILTKDMGIDKLRPERNIQKADLNVLIWIGEAKKQ